MSTFRHRFLTTLLASTAALASPAYAQDDQASEIPDDIESQSFASADQAGASGVSEEIIVTGTLIRNPNLVASSPVIVTSQDEIEFQQANVAEQILREIPGVVPSMGDAINNGNGGASYVDLRGLAPNRNIVLLDGYRLVPSDAVGRVDLNNIPLALIGRIEALTGAAVTTYGADAITGVVNFITRRDFSGFELTASEQITERGDGNVFRIDATIGADIEGGRGNVALSLGYQQSDAVVQGERPFSDNSLDSYSDTFFGSGSSVPTRFSGTRPIDPATGLPSTDPAVPNRGTGQIDPETGRVIAPYNTYNFNPFNLFQTPFERFNIFGTARYDVSDDIEVFARGIFSKNTVNTVVAPAGLFGSSVSINLNNPFLPAAMRAQLCAANVAELNDEGVQETYIPRFTPAQCDASANATGPSDPNYREVRTVILRRSVEAGTRRNAFETTFFDYRAGLRGTLTDTIGWEVSGAYGETENTNISKGYVITSRARQSFLVSTDASGNPVCNDPSNGCVPVDWFGALGSITPEAAEFLSTDSFTTVLASLAQARATINGDVGFALPWASQPVGFAVGAEYRGYTAEQRADALEEAGDVSGKGGATLPFTGAYNVREAFGEIIAPLIEDRPFFQNLTFEAGIRFSRYSIDAPSSPTFSTTTWKAGGTWEPGLGLRFRGNFNRAVRAPNIFELYNPPSTQLTNLAVDPCAGSAPLNNANLRAVCIAQGAPANVIGQIENPSAAQANITVGGNLDLQPETADTYTFGVVAQPDFIPGLALSADYYSITIKDVIGAALPGDLIGACFGNLAPTSAGDPACTSIRRDALTGRLSGDPIEVPGLFGPLSNLGRAQTTGIDATAQYRRDLGFARLSLNFLANWTLSSKFQAAPTSINRECVGSYSVNCNFTGSIQPKFQFMQRSTLSFGPVDLSLLWRHISSTRFEPQQLEDDLAFARANPDACPDPEGVDPGGCVVDPRFRKVDPYDVFDLSVRIAPSRRMTWTFTIQNLFDKQPPLLGNTIGSTSFNSGNTYPATYDALGRRFAASVRIAF